MYGISRMNIVNVIVTGDTVFIVYWFSLSNMFYSKAAHLQILSLVLQYTLHQARGLYRNYDEGHPRKEKDD